MTRQFKRYLVLSGVFSILAIAVVMKVTEKQGKAQGGSVSAKEEAKLITQSDVTQTELVDRYATLGTLKPRETIEIRNEVGGEVEAIGFEEGKRVNKGTRLLKIDDSTLQARRRATNQELDVAKLKRKRQKKVLEKGGISQLQYDMIASEVNVLEASLDEIESQIDDTSIHAPFAGKVGVRNISQGAVLPPHTTVAKLHKIDPIEIEFDLPEKYLSRISEGDRIQFRIRGGEKIHRAKVFALSNEIDESTRTLTVRAKAKNEDHELIPGQMAAVGVVLERLESAMTVPTTALLKSRANDYVYINDKGTAKKKTVDVGLRQAGRIQIKSGLEPGQKVILTGLQDLQDGQNVKVDTSSDAMNADKIQPDANRPGILQDVFSDESSATGSEG